MIQLKRLVTISVVVIKYRLDEFIIEAAKERSWGFIAYLLPSAWLPKSKYSRPERLRRALEELGPIFVKFGQMLSTRRDLLTDSMAEELKKLQDQVPPFDSKQAMEVIEQSLDQKISEIFASFEAEPLASASIAQVHAAQLKNGQEVVVKVVRPGIEKIITQDLSLMFSLARLVEAFWEEGKRLHAVDVVGDYKKTVIDELDLQLEAANSSQLKRNFAKTDILYIPTVHWDYTTSAVMVSERIYGIPVANVEAMSRHGINLKRLAEKGVEIFFTQVFEHSFFHADMHPGNIFVDPSRPEDPQYIGIDCAIIGSLTAEDQHYLASNLLAFFTRDYRRVAELHVESGWVPKDTSVNEFETVIRSVCEPIFEKPLMEISFGKLLLRLFQTARRFNMEVQPQLVLLQKTLLNIEGLGRQLYPELDLWQTAKPFLERWMKNQVSIVSNFKKTMQVLPEWIQDVPTLPKTLLQAADQLKHLEEFISAQNRTVTALRDELHKRRRSARTRWVGIILCALAVLPQVLEPLAARDFASGQLWLLLIGIGLIMARF